MTDIVAVVIAGLAAIVSGWALLHSKRSAEASRDSADAAIRAEHEREYGWRIESHDDPLFCFVLRNTGTVDAEAVALEGAYHPLAFKLGDVGPDDPVFIGAGQSRRFAAATDIDGNWGGDITITWTPRAGHRANESQTWVEAPPSRRS
ncbi:hypothetical protein I1A62_00615 (plasmid) [Rhodococcus sp. USK10]|uniref:hypothetical protein n=1 Tax=Rhodococcus sp. USK10 TaxID=2789739 RepID=UPI001C5FAAEE|nr:hypothetical protein [Rhodococcus sp. USK10]QYA99725.1 hypothetical protein I1A62_00615 [Rhodococcus sp. USK10]